ncbi:hypothetical protein [Acinetobacter baumannii]|uniref:hypothetical protein n=1 Tax=Acinetobacter baumannii TaxID=470 RepID=UPI000CE2F1B9|nr:hypothetical protein [Acinetobacter baumannii]PPB90500.1 hypothetical protein AbaMCR9238_10685 [Acinetobacter baumannii]PPC11942.1 hypothetical protein AbaMCR10126_07610 [Acinetobacter baumannii]PPC15358.1 hypothetical protein AbaMCR10172_12980 [Acinetobacter baumannii]
MQNDSNVETTQAEITVSFPFSLAEEMFDSNVEFNRILHVPTLNVGERVPEGFEEFLGDMDSKNAEDLVKQHPQLKQFIDEVKEYSDSEWNEKHATRLIRHHNNFEFLIHLHVAIPRDFSFTEEGKFLSCSIGGHYRCQWIFATSMKDAAEQAIKLAEQIHDQSEAKARKEQGLEG